MEIFNKNTSYNRRGKPPVLRLSWNGHIRFSVESVKILGLKLGDRISFMIDHKDKGIFFFYRDEENGMPLKFCTRGNGGVDGLQICCRPLGQKLLTYFGHKQPKTFDITNETCKTEIGDLWFVLKERLHVPIKWKKLKAENISI